MNIVVVRGVLARAPEVRPLPSGDRLAAYEVTVREPDAPTVSVPVVWFNPPDRAVRLTSGAEVVVRGRVRRRFFRTGGATTSRTEVVADQVLPATHRVRVLATLDDAVAAIAAVGTTPALGVPPRRRP